MKIHSKTKLNQRQFAFTLIESVIGMGILGIVLVALFGCFSFGFNVVRISREDLRAAQLLQEKMETIRLYNWTQLNQTNYVKRTFTAPLGMTGPEYFFGTLDIIDNSSAEFPVTNSYAKNLRLVKVSLSWTNNGLAHTRETSTLVSRYGLQQYVYGQN